MKKIFVILFFIIISLGLIACNNENKEEILDLFNDLNKDDIMNFIDTEEGRYSVYLTDDSPWLYYTFTNSNRHFIVVREERSFAHIMDDSEYSEIKDKRHLYYFDRSTKVLYSKQSDNSSEVDQLETDDLKKIVERVQMDLDQEGELLTFDSMYLIVKQFYNQLKPNALELMGDKNFSFSINFKAQEFLTINSSFKQHLEKIYDKTTESKIIDSINNNVYKGVNVQMRYNSEQKRLYPIINVKKNQLIFYVIDPLAEDYNF